MFIDGNRGNAPSILWGLLGPWKLRGNSGKVSESRKKVWAEVSAGREELASEGAAYSAPLAARVIRVVQDDLSLVGPNDEIYSLTLLGFDVECRPEQEITLISATLVLGTSHLKVAVRNHTTGKTFFSESALRKIFFPSVFLIALAPSLISISLVGLGVIDGLAGVSLALVLVGSVAIVSLRHLQAFKRNTSFDAYRRM